MKNGFKANATSSSVTGQVSELKELVVTYAKQETLEPVKGLARFVAFGTIGSVLVGLGLMLSMLAVLRALQTETGSTFQGSWSWAPYAITAGICLIFVGVAVAAASRGGDDS